jgi:hypothetical protein
MLRLPSFHPARRTLALVLVAFALCAARPAHASPVRTLLLGDSITFGICESAETIFDELATPELRSDIASGWSGSLTRSPAREPG